MNILNPYIVSSLCARTLDFYLAPVGIIERQYCLVLCSAVNLSKSATINRNKYFFWFELNRTEVQNRTKVHKREKKEENMNAMYMTAEGQILRQQWRADGGMVALIKASLQMEEESFRPSHILCLLTTFNIYFILDTIYTKVAHINM